VAELLGAHVATVGDKAIADEAKRLEEALVTGERTTAKIEAELTTSDGETRIGEATFSLTESGDTYERVGVIRDITERKERERELEHQRNQLQALNNLNKVIHEITSAVIDQSTREEIERTVCERLAESESYQFAWIGDVNTTTQTVNPRSKAGIEGYLDGITISVDPDDERSGGPTGRALRTGEPQITHDIRADSSHDPWREHIEQYGFRSSAAVPIVHEGTVYGVINIYTDRPYGFDGQERAVICQLGEIVGHAIAATERKQALMSDELVELEFQIQDVFAALDIPNTTDGTITLDNAVPIGDGEFLIYGTATSGAIDTVTKITKTLPHWQDLTIRSEGDPTTFELRMTDPPVLSFVASLGGYVEQAVIEDGDYRMTIHLAPSVSARRVADAVKAAYPAAEMIRRRQISRGRDDPRRFQRHLVDDLTDRQQTALKTAYHAGFFEWPRDTSGQEVAEAIGVTPPTFHQHLRKAERKVFDTVFSSPMQRVR
jgi:PAS domain-containing protein/DNA-binding CsgD family transcriptional regulator